MYDSDSMCVYHVSLNEDSLLDIFSNTWNKEPDLPFEILTPDKLTNQLAVLQHQLQTTTDPAKSKNVSRMMRHVLCRPIYLIIRTSYTIGTKIPMCYCNNSLILLFFICCN